MTKINKQRRERIDNRKKLQEWSKEIRKDGVCEVCGATKNLDSHHLLQKEYWPEHKLNLNNGIALCKRCHKFGKFAFHKNSIWSSDWLEKNRPEKYDWAWEVMNGLGR